MNVLPVIVRELRAQSRQRFTFALREIGVIALLGLVGYFFFAQPDHPPEVAGRALFSFLHASLFFGIWILVPLGASDCLSRERREGTLGLLFLTPLRAADVVLAKFVAHGLRTSTLLLAVTPVLALPVLMGGISWQQGVISAGIDVAALGWAMAATVLASSISRSGLRSMVMALVLSLSALLAFVYSAGWFALSLIATGPTNPYSQSYFAFLLGWAICGVNSFQLPRMMARVSSNSLLIPVGETLAFAIIIVVVAVGIAAWRIRRSWREEPPPVWVQRSQRVFCTAVVWKGLFRTWMRWLLARNPIGWLERRTWTGRLVTWAWFAVIISVYSAVLTDSQFFMHSSDTQITLAWLLMGSIAASVAGSFRRERESGVLELLLVAPITTGQIISGRLRGLWGQFLPAIAVLLLIWAHFANIFRDWEEFPKIFYFAATYFTLPVIGLYFSVRCRSYLIAFLATLFCCLFLPRLIERLLAWGNAAYSHPSLPFDSSLGHRPAAALIGLAMAAVFALALYRRLQRRDFPMERSSN